MQKNKNIVKAINKNVRSSPRKINILLKNIRGKRVDIAIRDLSFARQRIASEIKKQNKCSTDQNLVEKMYYYPRICWTQFSYT